MSKFIKKIYRFFFPYKLSVEEKKKIKKYMKRGFTRKDIEVFKKSVINCIYGVESNV